jgi:uncharacterized protein
MNSNIRIAAAAAIWLSGIAAAAGADAGLTALPGPIEQRNPPVALTVTGPDSFAIDASALTNWFVSPFDLHTWDNAPTLLFRPAENFALSARVSLMPKTHWDSGALVLFADKDHWAKLCLEASGDGDGRLQAVMVVTNGVSDDAYSVAAKGNTLYMRMARQGHAFAFFVSEDGANWQMIRQFRLGATANLRAGFLAQSPAGQGIHASFSEIRYKPDIKNMYAGE